MRRTAKEIALRADAAWTHKAVSDPYLADAYTLAMPGSSATNPYRPTGGDAFQGTVLALATQDSGNSNDYVVVLDGTLATAVSRLTNRILQELFPAGADWMMLRGRKTMEEGVVEDVPEEVVEVLQGAQVMFHTSLHASNIDVELTSAMTDCVISGMGCLRVHQMDEVDGPDIGWEAINEREVAVEYGPTREVSGCYRRHNRPREHLEMLWPEAKGWVDHTGDSPEEKAAPLKIEVDESVYWDKDAKKWRYTVVQKGEGKNPEAGKIVFEDEYDLNPFITFFYDRITGSVALRSPVLRALPAARTLNEMAFHTLEASAFLAVGMYMVEQGAVVNSSKNIIRPGGILHLRQGSLTGAGGSALQPLPTASRMDLAHMKREELVMQVKEAMMDESLPPETGAVRSATEIVARLKQLRANLGAFYSRLVRSAGIPIVLHVLEALERKGKLAGAGVEIEGGVVKLVRDGKKTEIVFTNPLLRAQHLTNAETAVQGYETIVRTAGREVAAVVIDGVKWSRYVLEQLEVPEELLRPEAEASERYQQMTGQLAQGMGALVQGSPGAGMPEAGPGRPPMEG